MSPPKKNGSGEPPAKKEKLEDKRNPPVSAVPGETSRSVIIQAVISSDSDSDSDCSCSGSSCSCSSTSTGSTSSIDDDFESDSDGGSQVQDVTPQE